MYVRFRIPAHGPLLREGVELLPSGCMEYMAERPRSHGLFSDADAVDMDATMAENTGTAAQPNLLFTFHNFFAANKLFCGFSEWPLDKANLSAYTAYCKYWLV